MNITMIAAAAVCISVITVSVRKIQPETGQLLAAAASVLLLVLILPYASEAVQSVKDFSKLQGGSRFLEPVLKITGISYITQLASQLCEDAGEKALASRVEMAGKIAICMITVPIAREAFIKITEIMK